MPVMDVSTTVVAGTVTVVVVGDVDMDTAPRFRDAVAAAVDAHQRTVVDLTGATFFDSSGLRVLLEYAAQLTEVTIPAKGILLRVFEVAGVDQVLPIRLI